VRAREFPPHNRETPRAGNAKRIHESSSLHIPSSISPSPIVPRRHCRREPRNTGKNRRRFAELLTLVGAAEAALHRENQGGSVAVLAPIRAAWPPSVIWARCSVALGHRLAAGTSCQRPTPPRACATTRLEKQRHMGGADWANWRNCGNSPAAAGRGSAFFRPRPRIMRFLSQTRRWRPKRDLGSGRKIRQTWRPIVGEGGHTPRSDQVGRLKDGGAHRCMRSIASGRLRTAYAERVAHAPGRNLLSRRAALTRGCPPLRTLAAPGSYCGATQSKLNSRQTLEARWDRRPSSDGG
jgi:hypothetical protein